MNRYMMIRRLRGPAFLMLVGVIALLAQAHILSWGRSWPLYLILAGVLALAERAALAAEGYPPYPGSTYQGQPYQGPGPYPGGPYSGAADPLAQAAPPPPSQQPGSAIVPASPHDIAPHDFDNDPNGGRR